MFELISGTCSRRTSCTANQRIARAASTTWMPFTIGLLDQIQQGFQFNFSEVLGTLLLRNSQKFLSTFYMRQSCETSNKLLSTSFAHCINHFWWVWMGYLGCSRNHFNVPRSVFNFVISRIFLRGGRMVARRIIQTFLHCWAFSSGTQWNQ